MIRAIAFGDRRIDAYVFKNAYSFFDGVYVEDDTMYHLSLEDPTDPECGVARRLSVGINFDTVAQLDTLIPKDIPKDIPKEMSEHKVERDIRRCLDKIIAHWMENGYEVEWCRRRLL
jgi:hypothetical protein